MDFLTIKDLVLDYFYLEFDHDLLSEKNNNPFLQVSLINSSSINPHRDSFGMYVIPRGAKAAHLEFSTIIMAKALVIEGEYLIQKPSAILPIENNLGYCRGITIDKNQVLLVTVIAEVDEAKFVTKSLLNKLQIVLNPAT